MNRLQLHVFLAAILAAPAVSAAQQAADSTLTLERAVARARAMNPIARAAGARRQVAEGRARNDAEFPNPTVELRRENLRSPLPFDEFATITLPFDVTGRRFALRSAVGRAAARGAADSALVERTVEYDAARAWVRLALAQGLSDVADEQRAAYERLATFDERRFAEGAIAEAAALRTRLEADRSRLSSAQAAAEAGRAHAELARLLGAAPAETPRAASLPPLAAPSTLPVADSAVREALSRRPELAGARALARETELRQRAEWLGILPDIGLHGGYKGTSGYRTGIVGVMVTMPVFNLNGGARERAAGDRRTADAELRDLESRVRAEATAAVTAYREIAGAASSIGPDFDGRAATISRSAEAAYREGATSLIDVLDAQRARADARATALRAAAELLLARLDLNRATGASILENR